MDIKKDSFHLQDIIQHKLGESEQLISFQDDAHGVVFVEWWELEGQNLFIEYAKKVNDQYY